MLDRFREGGAVMRIGLDAPIGEGVVCMALEIVRVQPEYNGDGDTVGGAVWIMVKPVGYEIDFEATKTYRFESLVETPDLVTGKTAAGVSFLFSIPEGGKAEVYRAAKDVEPPGSLVLPGAEPARRNETLDSDLTAHHKALSMKWTGPSEVEENEEDELPELVNP